MDKIILDVKPGMTDKWNRAFHRMKQADFTGYKFDRDEANER
jgi:hypothetical protein